ncbi:MAG: proprotein convertase P-domain-containing protein [Bacteroidota bacterium]
MKKTTTTLTLLLTLTWFLAHAQVDDYLMSSTLTNIDGCSGFFLDSGGGNGNYGPNESFTTTICPQGNAGTHVQLIFSGTNLSPGDQLCFFDGPNVAAPSLGCAADFVGGGAFIIQATAPNTSGCLTVTFDSNASGEGEGWSANIKCIPACQTIFSVIESTNPAIIPVDTGYIDICPGDQVFFTGRGEYPQDGTVYNHSDLTSQFEWDFGDGTSSFGPSVAHIFDEPGGYIVELKITDQLGCNNTNFIKQRIRVAPKPAFELGVWDDQICSGDTVNLNAMVNTSDDEHTVSVTPSEGTFQSGGIRSDSLPLPDGNGASYATTISFNGFAPGQVLTDINDLVGIFVNMEHSWMRDLEISIECPNGTSVMLHNHPGQLGGEVFLGVPYENDEGMLNPIPGVGYTYGWQQNPDYNYTWIEYANWFFPTTLPAGTYDSYEPLTNLVGCPLNGDWTITVTDLWSIDNGNIFSWSIQFDQDLFPALETFSPSLTNWQWQDHNSIFYNDQDSISASPINAGEVAYTFEVEDEFGCLWDTTVNIEVLPYTHPDCYQCEDILGDFPDSTICLGASVEMDVSTPISSGEITFESTDNYSIGASNHPPSNPYLSTINVNSVNPLTVTDPFNDIISICLDLETDFDANIDLRLVAPNGQVFTLSTNNGGAGDNYTQTCFTPTATTPIAAGTPPFTGEFLPEATWNALFGVPINGSWSLQVSDQFGIDEMGQLNWWSITFRTNNEVFYDWAPANTLDCNDCPNPIATPDDDEIYTVTASDIYGCSATEQIEIDVQIDYFAPDVQINDLPGGIAIATWNDANPGTMYEVNVNNTGWVPSNNGNFSHMINGLNFGNAINIQVRSIVMISACAVGIGYSSISYGFCTILAELNSPGPFAVTCNGLCDGAVEITVSSGLLPYTYFVTNNSNGAMFTQDNGILNDLCAGDYTVIVEDADDCRDTVEFVVENKAPIIVLANELTPVSCFGEMDGCATVQAQGGAGGFTFVWNDPNGSIGDMVCGLGAGPIIVTAEDADGCTGSGVATITEPDLLEVEIDKTDVNCLGGNDGTATATTTGGVMPYDFMWSSGNTPDQNSTDGLSAGNVSVIVTDANGCETTSNVDILEPADGVELTLTEFRGCNAQNQNRVESNVIGGTPPYTYAWTPTGANTPDIDGLPNGNYTCVVTDDSGCSTSQTVFVEDLPPIEIELAFDSPTCHDGDNGAMAANIVNGGTGTGYTYSWNTGDTNDFVDGLLGGLVYSVTVSDSQQCEGVASQSLPNPPIMVPAADISNVLCNGETNGEIAIASVANANGAVTFQWDAAANNQITGTATGLGAGDYSVVITDTELCTITATYTVGQPDRIEVDYQVVENECFGAQDASVDADVSGGTPAYSFNWSDGSTSAKLTDIPSGEYFVTITDANLCEYEGSVLVEQPDSVLIVPTVKDVSCFGDMDGAVTIEASGGTLPYRYSLDNNQFVGSKTLIALSAGDYTVYVRDANDCVYSTDIVVDEPPQISVSAGGNGIFDDELTILSGESVFLEPEISNATGTVSFTWTAGWCGTMVCGDTLTDCEIDIICETPFAYPDFTNDYFVLIEDENGCRAEDRIQVHVKKIRSVVVPTGFTPNGDGVNEILPVHGRSGTMIKLFQVFDRWGELLYQDGEIPVNDISRGWDGNFKGDAMPAGVYVWYIEAEYADGMTESFKGETTLIR